MVPRDVQVTYTSYPPIGSHASMTTHSGLILYVAFTRAKPNLQKHRSTDRISLEVSGYRTKHSHSCDVLAATHGRRVSCAVGATVRRSTYCTDGSLQIRERAPPARNDRESHLERNSSVNSQHNSLLPHP